jgi:hypothetical protein
VTLASALPSRPQAEALDDRPLPQLEIGFGHTALRTLAFSVPTTFRQTLRLPCEQARSREASALVLDAITVSDWAADRHLVGLAALLTIALP